MTNPKPGIDEFMAGNPVTIDITDHDWAREVRRLARENERLKDGERAADAEIERLRSMLRAVGTDRCPECHGDGFTVRVNSYAMNEQVQCHWCTEYCRWVSPPHTRRQEHSDD